MISLKCYLSFWVKNIIKLQYDTEMCRSSSHSPAVSGLVILNVKTDHITAQYILKVREVSAPKSRGWIFGFSRHIVSLNSFCL